MSVFLMQTIMAAPNNIEDSGWIQILVFVAMAVFWVIGAMKGKSRKKEQSEEQNRRPMHRSQSRPAVLGRGGEQQKLSPQQQSAYLVWRQQQQAQKQAKQQRVIVRPQPSAPKPAIPKRRVADDKLGTIQQLDVGDLVTEESMEVPKDMSAEVSLSKRRQDVEVPQPSLLLGLRSDYADPEKLRRAILQYEILGKPLSLRPPSEQMMG